MNIVIKLKSFSLAEALIAMLVVGILLAATLPLLLMKKKLDGRDIQSVNCIVTDSGNITSASCIQAINKCKYDQSNACNNLLYYADLGNSAAKTVLKEVCDQGGKTACNYFLMQCKDNVNNCDIATEDYDLQYYLNLPIDSGNLGKISLLAPGQEFYTAGYANIINTIDSFTCCPDLTLACSIRGITSCGPPPSQPGGASGTPGAETVDLSWTDSDSETGYKIMKSTDGTNYTEIADIAADSTSYQVTGLSPTTNYWFKVVAYNASGQTESNVITTTTTIAPPPATFQKRIDWSNSWDEGNNLKVDSSGNIYVLGTSYIGANYDLTVLKMDPYANITWNKTFYRNSANDIGREIAISSSGNIYIADATYTGTTWYMSILKLDSNGNKIWNKVYFYTGLWICAIKIDASENLYIAGYIGSSPNVVVIKMDLNGNTTWARKFGNSSDYEHGENLAISDSGNIYIGGHSLIGTDNDILLVKMDTNGNVIWQKSYYYDGSPHEDYGMNIAIDSQENTYITGYAGPTTTPEDSTTDIMVMKTDMHGNLIWQKLLNANNNSDRASGIILNSGNIYIVGASNNGTNDDIAIIKMNLNGNILWSKRLDSINNDDAGYTITAYDGKIYLTGVSNSDAFVLKMSQDQSNDNIFNEVVLTLTSSATTFSTYVATFNTATEFISETMSITTNNPGFTGFQ